MAGMLGTLSTRTTKKYADDDKIKADFPFNERED